MWVLMLKRRNARGESPKTDFSWKYSSNTRKPLIEPQTHNELVMVKSMSNTCQINVWHDRLGWFFSYLLP